MAGFGMVIYTSLEIELIQELESRNIEFRTQVPTRSGFVLDILIPPNIVIEADGPCHDSSKNKKRDRFRDRILKKSGYTVFRLSYKTTKNKEMFKHSIDEILKEIQS